MCPKSKSRALVWFTEIVYNKEKLGLQDIPRSVVKDTQPILGLLDKVPDARNTKVQLDISSLLTPLADAMTLLCHTSDKVSLSRRDMLRDSINPSYHSICSQTTPNDKWLCGAELPKHVKDIVEVHKLAKNSAHITKPILPTIPLFTANDHKDMAPNGKTRSFLHYGSRGKYQNRQYTEKRSQSFSKPSTTTNKFKPSTGKLTFIQSLRWKFN